MPGLFYARPSFLEGVARIFDFGNALTEYNWTRDPVLDSVLAIRAGWCTLGARMRTIMNDMYDANIVGDLMRTQEKRDEFARLTSERLRFRTAIARREIERSSGGIELQVAMALHELERSLTESGKTERRALLDAIERWLQEKQLQDQERGG